MKRAVFYILMALSTGSKSKVEMLDYVYNHTRGRVSIWPGTLHTLLDCFQKHGFIREAETGACGRAYALTEYGRLAYEAELLDLHTCLDDALCAATGAMKRTAV